MRTRRPSACASNAIIPDMPQHSVSEVSVSKVPGAAAGTTSFRAQPSLAKATATWHCSPRSAWYSMHCCLPSSGVKNRRQAIHDRSERTKTQKAWSDVLSSPQRGAVQEETTRPKPRSPPEKDARTAADIGIIPPRAGRQTAADSEAKRSQQPERETRMIPPTMTPVVPQPKRRKVLPLRPSRCVLTHVACSPAQPYEPEHCGMAIGWSGLCGGTGTGLGLQAAR